MKLEPVDQPRNPLMRLAFRLSKRQFGKVVTPMKVIYVRKPRLIPIAMRIARTLEHGLSLEPALRILIQVQASRLNGCGFCEDLALAHAVQRQIGLDRFNSLSEFRTSPLFSERERAGLAFTEEAVRDRAVSEATFSLARKYFSEVELVELAWLAAAETYFNMQAHIFGIGSDELLSLTISRG